MGKIVSEHTHRYILTRVEIKSNDTACLLFFNSENSQPCSPTAHHALILRVFRGATS